MPQKSTGRKAKNAKQVADRLHSAAIHLLRRLRRVDQASGLSAPKLSALSVIVHAGPISIGDLAVAEQVRAPTMTRLVKELEADRLIERATQGADRRVSRVRATRAGQRLLQQGRDRRIDILNQFVSGLTEAEIKQLEQAVEVIERFTRQSLQPTASPVA
jgi:DNA-binding MarR family transcriptional regulator